MWVNISTLHGWFPDDMGIFRGELLACVVFVVYFFVEPSQAYSQPPTVFLGTFRQCWIALSCGTFFPESSKQVDHLYHTCIYIYIFVFFNFTQTSHNAKIVLHLFLWELRPGDPHFRLYEEHMSWERCIHIGGSGALDDVGCSEFFTGVLHPKSYSKWACRYINDRVSWGLPKPWSSGQTIYSIHFMKGKPVWAFTTLLYCNWQKIAFRQKNTKKIEWEPLFRYRPKTSFILGVWFSQV